jgi:hypothetical protein
MRLGRSRESDHSNGSVTMRTHFLPYGREKMRTFKHRWDLEVIFCLLGGPKCDLVEVEKAMFQGVFWPYKLISFIVPGQKCVLCEVEKEIF